MDKPSAHSPSTDRQIELWALSVGRVCARAKIPWINLTASFVEGAETIDLPHSAAHNASKSGTWVYGLDLAHVPDSYLRKDPEAGIVANELVELPPALQQNHPAWVGLAQGLVSLLDPESGISQKRDGVCSARIPTHHATAVLEWLLEQSPAHASRRTGRKLDRRLPSDGATRATERL